MGVTINEGKYIYCIIASNEARAFGPLGIGDRGDELYTVCHNSIGAVVSNSPATTYSVSRDNTLAHERAIEQVMKEHTVLPVRFATIAKDEEEVKKILEKEYDKFTGLLANIKGKKELGLKALFIEEVIYKEILKNYQEIRLLKEAIASRPPEAAYYQRMEIGRMVEQALEEEKETYKNIILDILRPLAEDIKINNTYGERMILNAAFLVAADREPEFDAKIHGLDAEYGNIIKFKYIGTIPPFNFVNLIIETGKY